MTAHSAKSYYVVWGLLLALVAGSIGLGYMHSHVWTLRGIFILAAVKAYLVLSRYMHLKTELPWVKWILITGVLALAILFVALIPDIVYVYGRK